MTQVIVVYAQKMSVERYHISKIRTDITTALNDIQLEYLKNYVWRVDYNWHASQVEVTIRKKHFSTRDLTQLLFVFPDAYIKRGPNR